MTAQFIYPSRTRYLKPFSSFFPTTIGNSNGYNWFSLLSLDLFESSYICVVFYSRRTSLMVRPTLARTTSTTPHIQLTLRGGECNAHTHFISTSPHLHPQSTVTLLGKSSMPSCHCRITTA
jgi:hypothetical protein